MLARHSDGVLHHSAMACKSPSFEAADGIYQNGKPLTTSRSATHECRRAKTDRDPFGRGAVSRCQTVAISDALLGPLPGQPASTFGQS